MKKIIALTLIVLTMMTLLCSCGNQMFLDTNYTFKYAYVAWPDGTTECLEIVSWMDYEGEQLQIKTTDGNVYLFSSFNCVLTAEKRGTTENAD